MTEHKIFSMAWGRLYPNWVAKAERKGRTAAEVEEIFCWFSGHTASSLAETLDSEMTVGEVLEAMPHPNPSRELITGVVCGVRVEAVEDGLMRELRYIDKLIDELAKGKDMEKILRG